MTQFSWPNDCSNMFGQFLALNEYSRGGRKGTMVIPEGKLVIAPLLWEHGTQVHNSNTIKPTNMSVTKIDNKGRDAAPSEKA